MIDVEQRALGAFEQDALAGALLVVEQVENRLDIGQHLGRHRRQLVIDRLGIDLGQVETAAQRVVMGQEPLDLRAERRQIGQIGHADGAAADLVLVGRADAAAGRADLRARIGRFALLVELAVQRQDEAGILGNAQCFRRDRHALGRDALDLGDQRMRVDDDAIADHRQLAGPDDARGQKREFVGDAVDDERMSGIVAALEANHHIGLARQPVDDLAFAFVAPLGSDDNHVCHGLNPDLFVARQTPTARSSRWPGSLQCADKGSGRRWQAREVGPPLRPWRSAEVASLRGRPSPAPLAQRGGGKSAR